MARLSRTLWDRTQASRLRHSSHPLAASFPSSVRLAELPGPTATPAAQPIPGGNGEEIASLREADWFIAGSADPAHAGLELSPRALHAGQQGLRAFVNSAGRLPQGAAPRLEFSSAAVRVGEKRLICVRGWVRTPAALAGDGLLLQLSSDSPTMALPIRYSPRWQPFEICRATSGATEIRLLGRLETPGEIWLDDVELVDLGPLAEATPGYERLPVQAGLSNK